MNTNAHSPELSDSTCMAYGEQVKELLSMSEPAVWVDHLWTIYGGYMLAQEELGRDKHASDIFCTFRDLVFFFQKVEEEGRKFNGRVLS